MNEWDSYRVQDFIPFSPDVYFRLLARMGETFWPLQLVTLALGFIALVLALRGRGRLALLLLAPLWAFVGIAFFTQRYTDLNWVGQYLGWGWILQGAALLALALTGYCCAGRSSIFTGATMTGVLIALIGLLGFPLLAPVLGVGWRGAEMFGLHPDPTAVVSLGILLIALRGWVLWFLCLLPMLWISLSALTLQVLQAPWWPVLFAIVAASFGGLFGKSRPDVRPG